MGNRNIHGKQKQVTKSPGYHQNLVNSDFCVTGMRSEHTAMLQQSTKWTNNTDGNWARAGRGRGALTLGLWVLSVESDPGLARPRVGPGQDRREGNDTDQHLQPPLPTIELIAPKHPTWSYTQLLPASPSTGSIFFLVVVWSVRPPVLRPVSFSQECALTIPRPSDLDKWRTQYNRHFHSS